MTLPIGPGGLTPPDAPSDPVNGTFAFTIDSSLIDPSQGATNITLDALSLTIGDVTFDETNSGVVFQTDNLNPNNVTFYVGGNGNGNPFFAIPSDGGASKQDDFIIKFEGTFEDPGEPTNIVPTDMFYVIMNDDGLSSIEATVNPAVYSEPGQSISGTVNVVPEPASLALVGLGGLLITRRNRREKRH